MDLNCSNFFGVAIRKHYDQSNSGKKGFNWLTLPGHSPSLREVRAGAMEDCSYWLTLWLGLNWLSSTTKGYRPRGGPIHGGPRPISSEDSALQTQLLANLIKTITQPKCPSPRVI